MSDDMIYRQAAIDAVDVENLHRGIVEALQNIISELPSAEPESVHCKDCKHYICHDNDELPDYLPEWFCHHPFMDKIVAAQMAGNLAKKIIETADITKSLEPHHEAFRYETRIAIVRDEEK